MWQLILQYLGTAGGLTAIGMFARAIYTARVDKRAKVTKTQSDRQTADVDNIIKLLNVTPGEVVRLQESLAASEQRCSDLRDHLHVALQELSSVRGQMSQMEIQLARAMIQIRELTKGYEGNGTG